MRLHDIGEDNDEFNCGFWLAVYFWSFYLKISHCYILGVP